VRCNKDLNCQSYDFWPISEHHYIWNIRRKISELSTPKLLFKLDSSYHEIKWSKFFHSEYFFSLKEKLRAGRGVQRIEGPSGTGRVQDRPCTGRAVYGTGHPCPKRPRPDRLKPKDQKMNATAISQINFNNILWDALWPMSFWRKKHKL